jgi:hypothetical protein
MHFTKYMTAMCVIFAIFSCKAKRCKSVIVIKNYIPGQTILIGHAAICENTHNDFSFSAKILVLKRISMAMLSSS